MFEKYYFDTCIWLNLFKKEGNEIKGIPVWKIADRFIELVIKSHKQEIFYSGIVLRELRIKLGEKYYLDKLKFIEGDPSFVEIEVTKEDEIQARKLESFYDFEISFYDLIHVCICKRTNCILVTRDNDLLSVAEECEVVAGRPEELL